MSQPSLESIAREIASRAIADCNGFSLLERSLTLNGDQLTIEGLGDHIELDLTDFERVFVASSGKAAYASACGVVDTLGKRVTASLAVSKDERTIDGSPVELVLGDHPIPGDRSIRAGQRMLDFAKECVGGDLVIYILSGGSSALLEAPRHGITLQTIRDETRKLLLEGATIAEINAVRKRLSRVKAGGLADAFDPATVIVLVISDVEGDDLETIGSAPFWTENPLVRPSHLLLANAEDLRRSAADAAESHGFEVFEEETFVTGEAKFRGQNLAAWAVLPCEAAQALIAVGEPTVTVRGSGFGGRAQELALAAALQLSGSTFDCAVLAVGSDGTDGPTPAAGAVVTPQTVKDSGWAKRQLASNNAFEFHAKMGSLIQFEHPTGTNLNDLFIVLKRPG